MNNHKLQVARSRQLKPRNKKEKDYRMKGQPENTEQRFKHDGIHIIGVPKIPAI